MRKAEKIMQLELEIYKLRVELDLVYEILNNIVANIESQNMDSGKWYVRKQRPDFNN